MHVLTEKYVLKEAYRGLLPAAVIDRPKQPYRAPISRCFLPEQVGESSAVLRPEALAETGYFEPASVAQLLEKAARAPGGRLSDRDDMALAGMASLELLHRRFVGGTRTP